jgi:hypothetical protein
MLNTILFKDGFYTANGNYGARIGSGYASSEGSTAVGQIMFNRHQWSWNWVWIRNGWGNFDRFPFGSGRRFIYRQLFVWCRYWEGSDVYSGKFKCRQCYTGVRCFSYFHRSQMVLVISVLRRKQFNYFVNHTMSSLSLYVLN